MKQKSISEVNTIHQCSENRTYFFQTHKKRSEKMSIREPNNTETKQKPRKQKVPFTPEEDARLRELVAEKGDHNWNAIQALMPNRTSRQCRERWNLYLSPDVNNSPWTPEEVMRLYTLYVAVGPQWTLLSHQFPNRTANNIKNKLKMCLRRAQRMYRIPEKDGNHKINTIAPVAAAVEQVQNQVQNQLQNQRNAQNNQPLQPQNTQAEPTLVP